MKKSFLLFFICFSILISTAQQVDRDKVIVEIATGTWCSYCPGAAMGADDLVANGHDVAIIEYHNGDGYANTYSNYRNNYYNISGYPTATFGGILKVGGGSHSQSMYPQYLSKYNLRKAVPSSFTLEFDGTHEGLVDFDISVTAEKVATTTSTNMVLHVVLTESHIQETWQGLSELNFVERSMYPNQFGTSLDFTSTNTQIVNVNFSLQSLWVAEHCELVAFIQDLSTKEILQGTKINLTEFEPLLNYDAAILYISNIPNTVCEDNVSPKITIQNNGAVNLTSLDIEYKINNGNINTHNWAGDLAYLESEDIDLPSVNFTILDNNTINIELLNPNGQTDQYPQNNTANENFDIAPVSSSSLLLYIRTDNNPEETTWEIKNTAGQVFYSGGPFTQPLHIYNEFIELNTSDCYKLIIYDSGGNGLCCENGNGFYKLFDAPTQSVICQGNSFKHLTEDQFEVNACTDISEQIVTDKFNIFPNPFNKSTNISFSIDEGDNVSLNVYNSTGEIVYSIRENNLSKGNHTLKLEIENISQGIYYVHLLIGNNIFTKKVIFSN
ncbi:MAG: T9SS type A sorting domain-containing protein [Bacteroidales bacterium]|nr:T9SS type A sorting domain-containing protein [Bacteroidales bacterium]